MEKRLHRLLEEYQLNSSQLADILGVQRSGISHILAGRNKPSFDFMVRILENFPEIDANWLISGNGRMFKEEGEDEIKPSSTTGMPSLFDSVQNTEPPVNQKKQEVKPSKDKTREIKESVPEKSNDTDGYKSKQVEYAEDGIELVIVFYRSGKFKRYLPQ
jgi:transcriptional regulator with XRE-family HTH domain